MATMVERFENEGPNCIYLGPNGNYDLYIHLTEGGSISTVIARYGPEGEYISGIPFISRYPQLREAADRALALGYKF